MASCARDVPIREIENTNWAIYAANSVIRNGHSIWEIQLNDEEEVPRARVSGGPSVVGGTGARRLKMTCSTAIA